MKNYLKALIVFILVFACAIACVSCSRNEGGEQGGDNNGDVVKPPMSDDPADDEESYRIRFVYSYTAKVVNDNGRTENKKEVVTVKSVYVPVTNTGLTDANKAEINALAYHGYSFVNWYTEWDKDLQVPTGEPFDFNNSGAISKDITLYGERGTIAGPEITWEIVYEYEELEEDEDVAATSSDATEGEGEDTPDETPEDKEPAKIGATLYLKGKGNMFEFANGNEIDVPWYKDVSLIKTVVIDEGITSIGSNSFKNFGKLTTVKYRALNAEGAYVENAGFPSTIKTIGDSAFLGVGLKSLTTPAGLTRIEKNGFANTALRDVTLNEGIVALADQAFYGSNKIRTIVIPTSLTSIGNSAFHAGLGNSNHNLSKVFYAGNAEGFAAIDISMDNIPLVDRATIYYYIKTPDEGADEIIGNFWHYVDEANKLHPIQYCYTLSYTEASSKVPFDYIYVPATPVLDDDGNLVVDEEGVPSLEGIITEDIYNQHKNIRFNGYTFAGFTGGKTIAVGEKITDDTTYKGTRGDILSEYGGIRFSVVNNVITVKKDDTTEERIRADVKVEMLKELTKTEAAVAKKAEIVADIEAKINNGEISLEEGQTAESLVDAEFATYLEEAFAAEAVQDEFEDEVEARLDVAFEIWDFPQVTDTGLLWTGALSGLSKITGLVIEEGVEHIGTLTFNGLSNITEITLPASLKSVGDTAFSGCSRLVSIYYSGLVDGENGCPSLNDISGVRATVYSKTEEAVATSGNYWMDVADKRIAWVLDLEKGSLTLGGDNNMVNFDTASSAPWFGAKDSITKLVISNNIVSLGENIANGYEKITSITLPNDLRTIPESSLKGTGVLNDTTKYNKGILMINGHLLKVDSTMRNTYLFETPYGTSTIADGAFAGCDAIKRLYLVGTIKVINANAFPDTDAEYIYTDNDEVYWNSIKEVVDFGDAVVLYKSNSRPMEPVLDESGKPAGYSQYVDGKYWFKSGNDYVIWGCSHVWSDWFDTKAPTCSATGTKTRYCIYDKEHTEVQTVPMLNDHTPGEYKSDDNETCQTHRTETAACTNPSCTFTFTRDAVDEEGNLIYKEHNYGEFVWDGAESASCKVPYGTKSKTCLALIDGTACGQVLTENATADDVGPDFEIPGHTPAEVADPKYFVSAATLESPAVYKKSCSVCFVALEETFQYGEKLAAYDFEAEDASAEDVCSSVQDYCWDSDSGVISETKSVPHYAKITAIDSNKVLEVGMNSFRGSLAHLRIANSNAKTAENAVHVMETKFMIDQFTFVGEGYIARIMFDNGAASFFTLQFDKVDDNSVKLSVMDDAQVDVVKDTGIVLKIDVMYTLRVEYYVGEDKAEKVVITATAEDEDDQSCTVDEYASTIANDSFYYVKVDLRSTEANYLVDTKFYFDDLFIGTMGYEELFGAVEETPEA